jgi:DNA helicase-2/ATP-dependent DNA helicase PcrA
VTDPDRILDGLNPEQAEAARAVRGPVVILAGAGTGKTTTITHRIAYQVATGTFEARAILAVSFMKKARTEMLRRLETLGIEDVHVRTIHSTALSQLGMLHRAARTVGPEPLNEGQKHSLMKAAIAAAAPQHEYAYRNELFTIIGRAKGSLIEPTRFEEAAEGWSLPIDVGDLARIYGEYERLKAATGRIDFEDMQVMALAAMRTHPDHAERVRARVQSITVDEFQDVSLVQVQLLEEWLGGRDEICVVGDDYQSIFGFRGGSPSFLVEWRRRYPHAKVVTLEANYRSTPEILNFANRLMPALGGHPKNLRPTRPAGPEPALREVDDEQRFVVDTVKQLNTAQGIAFEEMAVLVRNNDFTVPFEEAFAASDVPYRVEEGGFLERPAIVSAMRVLRDPVEPVMPAVERAVIAGGLQPGVPAGEAAHERELETLLVLAREFVASHDGAGVKAFVDDLTERFTPSEDAAAGRGVRLMTYHKAKGLEFDAVFLPRLASGDLPSRTRRVDSPVDEERRILYVGITRARRHLFVTRSSGRVPSAFWRELSPPPSPGKMLAQARPWAPARQSEKPNAYNGVDLSGTLLDVLKRWRIQLYRRPTFSMFQDDELLAIARAEPRDKAALRGAIKPEKADKYALELLDLIAHKSET